MSENKIKLKYLCESFNSAIIASALKAQGKTAVYGASGLSGYSDNDGISKEYLGIVKDGAGVGRIAQYKAGTLLVGTMSYIFPKNDCDINWLKYCIASLNLGDSIDKATIPHIYFSDYGNRSVLNLSREEQKKTANFLEGKASLVNQLISNQEKQIEKLKEYRQAIITKAVTKGLDPNAPMKDSGVEWIGNIPCNWETLRLKYCFSVRNEKYENGNYDYVALENVESFSGKYIATESNAFYSLAGTIRANRNDVIFGKLRPYLSKAFLIAKDCYVSSEFAVLYGLGGNRTSFLKYLLISSKFIDVINSSTYGTKMPRANIDFIRNLEIAIPDVKTQNEIVNYLDETCRKIDRLIDVKVKKIAQLSNYKKSLIYEYVTGKKRVSL